MSSLDRFWKKVSPEPNTGCWLWDASGVPEGYGVFFDGGKKKQVYAHRFSFEEFREKIPDNLEIDHLCRVRCCVNPDHMEIVTHRENINRRHTPRGMSHFNSKKTHCKNGHPYNPENTSVESAGKRGFQRTCRVCRRLNWATRK